MFLHFLHIGFPLKPFKKVNTTQTTKSKSPMSSVGTAATWPQLLPLFYLSLFPSPHCLKYLTGQVSDMMELWAASSHSQKYDKGVDGLHIRQPSTSVELCGPEQHAERLTRVDSASSYIQQPKTATRHARRLTCSEGWPQVHLFMLRSHGGSWSTSCHSTSNLLYEPYWFSFRFVSTASRRGPCSIWQNIKDVDW